MAVGTLTSTTIKSTYKSLLKVKGGANQLLDGTPRLLEDGDGNDSVLAISTDSVLISGSGTKLDFSTDGSGEYLSGDGTDLTLGSGADINLTATSDVNIPVNVGLRFGDGGENIETDNTDLTITSGGDIILSPTSNVGIGTASPGSKLEIDLNTSGILALDAMNAHATGYGAVIGGGSTSSEYALDVRNNAGGGLMRVLGDGNVGIGTTAPSTLAGNSWTDIELQVKGASGGGSMAISGATQAMLFLSDEDAAVDEKVWGVASVNGEFRIDDWTDAEGLVGTRLLIDNAGNVGIGETAPWEALSIPFNDKLSFGSTTYPLSISRSSSGSLITTIADSYDNDNARIDFTMKAGAVNALSILGSGKVGIGTTSPSGELHVKASGTLSQLPVYVDRSDGTVIAAIETDSSGHAELKMRNLSNSQTIHLTTSGDSSFTGGNVGIGTATPKSKVESSVGNQTILGLFSASGMSITSAGGSLNNLYQVSLGYGGGTYGHSAISGLTTSSTGYNAGALVFATRSATTDTAPTERMRIDDTGNVGIGTTSPNTTATSITIEDIANDADGAGIALRKKKNDGNVVNNDGMGLIDFWGYHTDGYDRGAYILASVDGTPGNGDLPARLVFATTADGASDSTERMRIDSSGNIGINKTPQSWHSNKRVIQLGDRATIAGDQVGSHSTFLINNAYHDSVSTVWEFQETAAACYLYLDGGEFSFFTSPSGTADTAITWTNRLKINNTGDVEVNAGNLVIGTSDKGIDFSASTESGGGGTSEILDDYEEGAWTPVLSGTTGAGTISYNSQIGRYTKVGDMVNVAMRMHINTVSVSPTGNSMITGLPFTSSATYYHYGSLSMRGITVISNTVQVQASLSIGKTEVYLRQVVDGNNQVDILAAAVGTNDIIEFTLTYSI